jgi:hypothetical protein
MRRRALPGLQSDHQLLCGSQPIGFVEPDKT